MGEENKYGGRDRERRVCLHPSKPGGSLEYLLDLRGKLWASVLEATGLALSKGKSEG